METTFMKKTLTEALSDELPLNTGKHQIERGNFNVGAYAFWNFAKTGEPEDPISFCEEAHYDLIPYIKIAELKETLGVEKIAERYVTVLRIFLGFRDNRIKLIFVPDKARNIAGSNKYAFDVPYKDDPEQMFEDNLVVYHWNGSKMSKAIFDDPENSNDCPKIWIKDYQSKIILDKDGTGSVPFGHFESGAWSNGITFTFQALNKFYSLGEEIYVTNVMSVREEIGYPGSYYHSIAFSNEEPVSPLVPENNESDIHGVMRFSDLGTLCPVRCSDISIVSIDGIGNVELSKFNFAKTLSNLTGESLRELV